MNAISPMSRASDPACRLADLNASLPGGVYVVMFTLGGVTRAKIGETGRDNPAVRMAQSSAEIEALGGVLVPGGARWFPCGSSRLAEKRAHAALHTFKRPAAAGRTEDFVVDMTTATAAVTNAITSVAARGAAGSRALAAIDTPSDVAEALARRVFRVAMKRNPSKRSFRVLLPASGGANLIGAVLDVAASLGIKVRITVNDIEGAPLNMALRAAADRGAGGSLEAPVEGDFTQAVVRARLGLFDVVLMNPPWSSIGNRMGGGDEFYWAEFVKAASGVLRVGGVLGCVMSSGGRWDQKGRALLDECRLGLLAPRQPAAFDGWKGSTWLAVKGEKHHAGAWSAEKRSEALADFSALRLRMVGGDGHFTIGEAGAVFYYAPGSRAVRARAGDVISGRFVVTGAPAEIDRFVTWWNANEPRIAAAKKAAGMTAHPYGVGFLRTILGIPA